jgi:threonine/homoserine/homoserine lactone efflux protein
MCSGITVHTLAAAAGISALFYASATLFTLVKYAGAAYLLYLSFMAVKESKTPLEKNSGNGPGAFALFKRGFIMNVLNPKVALFFLAFLPQFTVKGTGSIALQMVALGLIFMVQAMIIFTLIGFFSGSVGEYVIARPKIARYFNWMAAGIFASLGIKLAFTHR